MPYISSSLKTLCVFCGGNLGIDPEIRQLTKDIGRLLAEQGISIVCGGSQRGLMGTVTDSVLDAGGEVLGILADVVEHVEMPHARLTQLIRTPCLPTRKQKMIDISDGFLVLPGGFGTMDELFEILVLRKIHVTNKPVIIVNFKGFWDATLQQIDRMVCEEFVSADVIHMITLVDSPQALHNVLTQQRTQSLPHAQASLA